MTGPKTKKTLVWIFSITGFLILLLAGVFLIVSYLVFDKESLESQNKVRNPIYFTLKLAKIQREMRQENPDPAEIKTVVFSEKELNSFFYTASGLYNAYLQKKNEKKPYKPTVTAEFKEGLFTAYISIKTRFHTPFGSIVNIPVTFSIEWKNGKPVVHCSKALLGKHNISPGYLEQKIAEQIESVRYKPQVSPFMKAIVSVKTENNRLVVQYRPALLANAFDQVVFGRTGFYTIPGQSK